MPLITHVIPAQAGIQNMNNETAVSGLALDIDDTLSWTCREWVDIIHQEFGNPENLTKYEFVEKYRLLQKAPYIQREEIINRIREMCFDESYHDKLPIIDEAPMSVRDISAVIPIIAYLTARPECLRVTTLKWLEQYGFPCYELIMRPDDIPNGLAAAEWKSRTLESLHPKIIGIIDDNPSICKGLSDEYQGTVFLYGNNDADVQHPCAVACRNWSDVVRKVKKQYLFQLSECVN